MARALVVLFVGLLCAVFACDRTQADTGSDALLQVSNAQFFREPLPADTSGPTVSSLTVASKIKVGAVDQNTVGEGAHTTAAFAFGIAGDIGYWIQPAGVPSSNALGLPTFDTTFALARSIVPGPHDLVVRAIDADHHFGPPLVKTITVLDRAPIPDGQLVVALSWDNAANLDLHVVDPDGAEIFKRDINSYSPGPPGSPRQPPGTPHDGGVLDFDSDADCVTDGLSAEHVVWTDPPPKGHYVVRVDTFSLCGEPIARWRVQALINGVTVGSAEGFGTEADTYFDHNRGAGALALEFDVPP